MTLRLNKRLPFNRDDDLLELSDNDITVLNRSGLNLEIKLSGNL